MSYEDEAVKDFGLAFFEVFSSFLAFFLLFFVFFAKTELFFASALKITTGKPAGVRCIQLNDDNGCMIFGQPGRPAVCASLMPDLDMCGPDRAHAMIFLTTLERLTA